MPTKKTTSNQKSSFSNFLKKGILFGLGAFDYSKEKLEKNVNEFMSKEKIDRTEGRKMVEDVLKKAETYKKGHEKYVRGVVKSVIDDLGLVTKKDLEMLRKMETPKAVKKAMTDAANKVVDMASNALDGDSPKTSRKSTKKKSASKAKN